MKEIETKIIGINVDEIRSKLLSINALKVKVENQINNIYDFPDRTLINNKGYARIRIVDDLLNNSSRCYMTTKKLLSQDKFKVMAEHETEIMDASEGDNIFKALGLELIESIKKYRESYKYKNTLIEIDINDKSFFPLPYIEVECSDEKELEEIICLLGYTLADTSSETMYELKERYHVGEN